MKTIILDFNGTIINDTDLCIACENETIKHFNLDRGPISKEEYLQIFTFPVEEYYKRVGFDFEKIPYSEVGAYWFNEYLKRKDDYVLHDGVLDFLKEAKDKNYELVVLSASKKDELEKQIEQLGINEYFSEILGIDNIYAGSKIEIAKQFIKDRNKEECLMIGDTLHDLQSAKAMGIDCILVARGHQAKDILLKQWDKVFDSLYEVKI